MNGRRLRIYVALGITVMWGISYAVSVGTGNYAGLSAVTPVMLLAAAWLMGAGMKGNGNDQR